MTLRTLYRLAFLATTGGLLFQATTTSCNQALDSFVSSAVPIISSTATSLLTDALQGGSTTTGTIDTTCPNSVFGAVCSDIQNVNSGVQGAALSPGGTSSDTSQ